MFLVRKHTSNIHQTNANMVVDFRVIYKDYTQFFLTLHTKFRLMAAQSYRFCISYLVLDLLCIEFCDVFRVKIKFVLMKSNRRGGKHWAACSNYVLFTILSRAQDRLTTYFKETREMTWKSGLNKCARANSTWEWTIFVVHWIESIGCVVCRGYDSR